MSEKPRPLTRRNFLKSAAAFGSIAFLPSSVVFGQKSSVGRIGPNDRIRLAVVGTGNRGDAVRRRMVGSGLCEVVAICDVDMEGGHTHRARYAHGLTNKPPSKDPPEVEPLKAAGYTDFRVMFDEMGDEIDAVMIGTPDHSHFAVTILAMSLGKHVYVEKPLAHTFGQCERLIQMSEANPNLVTQMGNQGHSGANYFQFKAWREADFIRDVNRITAFMNNNRRWHGWGESVTRYPTDPLPKGVDWEQWLDSVAVDRPFSDRLHPQEWRSWYEFGSGAFGDWGPHILDTAHRFLELGYPTLISAVDLRGVNPAGLVYPQESTIRFDFPARGPGLPACEVTWYDGVDNVPELEPELSEVSLRSPGKVIYSKDLTFKGDSHGSPLRVVPREKFIEVRSSMPDYPKSPSNHYENFLLACRGEEEARSPFSVSGPLTQVFNLGVLAQRLGGEIRFDPATKQITNNAVANALLDPPPRSGWEEFYSLPG